MFKINRWMLYVCCLLPLEAWSVEASSQQDEIKVIEEDIQVLKERWQQINLREMKGEVKGQGLMIADWEGYRRELERIREQEKEDNQIELRIKQLEERKAQLLKQQQQPHSFY